MGSVENLAAHRAKLEERLLQTELHTGAVIEINSTTSKGFKPVVRRADTIKERKLEPLWPGVLWRGYPTILAGEAGLSKSTVSVDIAARLTRGAVWPGSNVKADRGNTLFLTAEDMAEDVVKPRLRVAGADMTRIFFFDGLRNAEGKESDINLTEHLPQLDATVAALDIDLVIVDPISAYEGHTDSHKNSEVRAMLKGVQRVAGRRKCSFLLISHYNKSTTQSGLQRIVGSIAYGAAVRAAYAVLRDEADPDSRLMLPAKLNFVPDGSGFRYSIENCDGFPKINWSDEAVTDRLDDVLNGTAKPKRELCLEFLEHALGDGEIEAEELKESAQHAGFGVNVIYKALRSTRFLKTGGGNQHSPAVYRLISSDVIEVSEDWDVG